MHSKNCELESEIAQLKQNLNDLRIQSRNAEELNSQLAIEIEHHQSYNSEWKMRYQELSSKFSSALEDNEQCQKMIIALKSQVQTVMKENEHAKESLKYYQNELKCAEYELAESNERTTDLNRVYGELKEEKKVTQELKEKIWSFEESFKDLKYELSEKEQQTPKTQRKFFFHPDVLPQKNVGFEFTENRNQFEFELRIQYYKFCNQKIFKIFDIQKIFGS